MWLGRDRSENPHSRLHGEKKPAPGAPRGGDTGEAGRSSRGKLPPLAPQRNPDADADSSSGLSRAFDGPTG